MRSHTIARKPSTAFRLGLITAAAIGVSLAASPANADVASLTTNSSTGTAPLKFEMNKGLDTTIDTGYLGPSIAQIRAVIAIDPVKAGGPLYSVDMQKGAVIQATWSGDKKLVLKATNGAVTDGSIKVRHTLTPTLDLKVVVPVVNQTVEFRFDANSYVNKLPGARFAYDSKATQSFAPWAFTAIDTKLNSPDLADSTLFSEPFSVFGDILDPAKWDGSIGIRATTKPTFSYRTTRIMLAGSSAPITQGSGEAVVDAEDGDYLEIMAQVEGEMAVSGTMEVQPFVSISKAAGYTFGTSIDIPGFSKAYTAPPQKMAYQATLVHIPLPNVHAPKEGVDLGEVKSGGSATKTVTIENSGEMAATMTFKSSDSQFSVPGDTITVEPKAKYEMQIKFAASGSAAASSDITVLSNDPDSPEQTFKIGANGADVGSGSHGGSATDPAVDSGCGCRTAGTTTSSNGWLGIGLVALGAVVVAARRRRQAA